MAPVLGIPGVRWQAGVNADTANVIIHPVYLCECGEVAYCSFKRSSCYFHLNP